MWRIVLVSEAFKNKVIVDSNYLFFATFKKGVSTHQHKKLTATQ